jgi:hypothetical protein
VISGATNKVVAQVRYTPRGFGGGAVDPC